MRKVVYSVKMNNGSRLRTTDFLLAEKVAVNKYADIKTYLCEVDLSTPQEKERAERTAKKHYEYFLRKKRVSA